MSKEDPGHIIAKNQQSSERLSPENLVDRYRATQRLFKWWEEVARDFGEDTNIGRAVLPVMMTRAYPELVRRRNMIVQTLPRLRENLKDMEKQLSGVPFSDDHFLEMLKEDVPQRNFLKIAIDMESRAPTLVANFICGEPCDESQMDLVVQALIEYLITHPEPFKNPFRS